MTLSELIEKLNEIQEEHGDAEVRLAQQPSWPFEYSISDVIVESTNDFEVLSKDELEELDADELKEYEQAKKKAEEEASSVVYIGEGSQLGYLPGSVSKSLGWR